MILFLDGTGLENYEKAMNALNIEYTKDLARIDECDGLLIPGGYDVDPALYHEEDQGSYGYDIEKDRIVINAIDHFVKNRKKIFGICRGHQLLNIYFGGTLYQDIKTVKRHNMPDYSEAVHEIDNSDFLEKIYGPKMMVNSTHHQAVKDLGKGLIIVAKDDEGIVEGMRHETLPIISVQFHPERMVNRTDTDMGYKLFEYFMTL